MKSAALTVKIFAAMSERSMLDRLALAIATCGGVGYAPLVPASWGSLVGVGIYLLAQKISLSFAVWSKANHLNAVALDSLVISLTLISLIALFLIGIRAATRVEQMTGEKDPRIVVIDEVVGQLITFLFIPAGLGWWTAAAGFLAFRLFDIWKLYPANKLEAIPNGLGVMADDVMAGIYAAGLISLLCSIYLMIW